MAPEPVNVQYMPASHYLTALPVVDDPFRHQAGANSHNHHEEHPWGQGIIAGTKEFDALYAEANNKYMYHLWYTPELAPHMATKLLKIHPLNRQLTDQLVGTAAIVLEQGLDAALQSKSGQELVKSFQDIVDDAVKGSSDPIFVRLGATSAKDSFAKGAPTTKPGPLPPNADLILRRFLSSGRAVGRLLALSDRVWAADPGEALIIQKWSEDIQLHREIRVFCHRGRVTAISQDIWWEKTGWRQRYSDGFVDAIAGVWDKVKAFLPFDTCTMDVLVTPPEDKSGSTWTAKVIEFNGFGAHLNTGSDLFHWVKDADILHGHEPGITIRFVDDWEGEGKDEEEGDDDDDEPDWLVLERELQAKYASNAKDPKRLEMEKKTNLPLRGRWCSAY